MKKIILTLAILGSFAVATSTVHAENPDKLEPTREKVVNDYAGVLSDKTKQIIIDKNHEYSQSKTQPQVVVTTVKSTGDMSIRDFTNDLMARSNWKIGSKKYNNGVHIIFATNNGQNNVRINTGYGVESTLTDNKAFEILQNNKKLLKSSNETDIDKGLYNVFTDVTHVVGDGETSSKSKSSSTSKADVLFWLLLLIPIIIVGLFAYISRKKSFNNDSTSSGFFFGDYGSSSDNSFWDSGFGDSDSGSSDFGGSDFGGGDSGGGGSDF